jgi:IclR family mhp operon transcriptional activator
MRQDQELTSLKRGLRILTLLNAQGDLSIAEVARALSIPRTTAERVVLTLLAEGYVVRNTDTKAFQLAPKVCALASGFSDESWITQTATPLLFELTGRIGWPLAIATPRGEKMIVRVTTDPATSLQFTRRYVGTEIAMMQASSGLVLLAYLPDHEREVLLDLLRRSPDPAQKLANDKRAVRALIAATCNHGCAFAPVEHSEGSLSVPIFLHGRVHAVLLMMYFRNALSRQALLRDFYPQLRQLADEICRCAQAELTALRRGVRS